MNLNDQLPPAQPQPYTAPIQPQVPVQPQYEQQVAQGAQGAQNINTVPKQEGINVSLSLDPVSVAILTNISNIHHDTMINMAIKMFAKHSFYKDYLANDKIDSMVGSVDEPKESNTTSTLTAPKVNNMGGGGF